MNQNDKLIAEHKKEKNESVAFKRRRFEQWNQNYSLYRDRVETNRLTQRQAINIPIMRETIQTWVAKNEEPPQLKFKSRGRSNSHKNGEILVDEIWGFCFDKLKLDILDQVDKKIVGLQGRSFKIAGMNRGEFFIDLLDPYDIEISPRVSPFDLNSAAYVIRTGIFKPLREILANSKYEKAAKDELKAYLDTKDGLIKAAETRDAYLQKVQRIRDLGAENYDDYNATEVLVEINESYKMIWNKENNQFVRHLIKFGADKVVLYNKPIKEALGLARLPIVTWADDPDLNDIWCDGKGDSVRTINKVVNMYISSDVENRMYRTFGMYFFNSQNGTYKPQAFDPKPFAMFGVPGNPAEVVQQVRIEPLGDTSQQIGFLKDLIQSSVAQTPLERGEQSKSRTTFGEVQLNLQMSGERNSTSSKHYRRAWEELGAIFYELLSNNTSHTITVYKKRPDGDLQMKEIYPSEWNMPEGYQVEVIMRSEAEALDQFALQKVQYAIQNFQDNPAALKIAKKKQLELMEWTQEEIDEALAMYEQPQPMQLPGQGENDTDLPEGQDSGNSFNNQQLLQQQTA